VVKKYLFALLAGVVLSSVGAVRAQEVTNPNHTVVRFEVSTGGQPFGSLDIELFDQEKPETVKNFLRYVYRGVYSNLVIHRLVQNFVLQGGHVKILDSASTDAFSEYTEGLNYGPITNEYSVGPELSNEFGTIAMARIGGQPNSASAQWFFNLTNNPFLDSVDGGFTVFGRVVNTTNAFTGTNLLQHFNTVPVASAFIPGTSLTNVPVSGTPLPSPRYADLFTVQAKIIQGPQLPAPQHSVVRFNIFTGGTNFGNIDIELFDQEKPETVKNFLLYVYSGVYSNLVMHRLVPGFVLQAGRVRLADPNVNAAFSTYIPGVNWGPITNEYGFGPELGNDYGTIAMARVSGDTNSASGDFFFNLTNNATLNTNDGGFTVFGRVINSYDARSGTNLLNYFNSFSSTQGLGSAFIFDYFEFLSELAVSTNRPTVMIPDLFTIRSSVIQGVTERDTSAPLVTVQEPVALPAPQVHRTTNATYFFTGTASDNQGLSRILIDAASGQRYLANGKTNWSFEVPLVPGTNRFVVRSLDEFGNLSSSQERVVFYSLPRPLMLQIEGKGKTFGVTNGQILEVGVNYPLTAVPARGHYFLGWQIGDDTSRAPAISFTMEEDAVVFCRFSRTLFGLTTGRYEGVFAPTTNGLRKSEGQITLTLRANGYYTGRLKPFGANYSIRGRFDANGQTVIYGTLGTNVLALGMGLGSEGLERINGAYTDGTFLSDFVLWRQQVYGKTNPSPYAGSYTFTLSPPLATNNAVTDGSGFGTATVDAKGRIKWTGVLADGVALKAKASELKGGVWSFYYPTKLGEALAGEAKFTTNGTFSGNVKWFSPGFPGLTNQNVKLTGARYTPPASGRPFEWTNGVLTISGGGLSQPIVSDVVVQADGSLTVLSNAHNIQINVTNATGLVGGTFQYPGSNTLTRLRGAVLQSSNSAAGFAPVSPRSAGFELRRAP
jgi:cyclophilin family peptidyl-prolyl cis-trans isomerase